MSEQGLPSVSIVIPCYNQARYLPQAIESALSQTYSKVEIIVVNDGSTDDTAEVAARYPQVRYFAQSNRGVAEARNSGFAVSKGDFIQFLDADDRLAKEAVEAHLRCFAAHPDAGWVVGDIEWIDEEGRCLGRGNAPLLDSNHYEELLKINHVANTIAVLLRRSVLRKVGGFNGFFSPAEDYEMLLRAARAFPSAHHSTVVAQYRRHTTNTSRRGATMLKATNRVFVAERAMVKGSPHLEAALRKGEQNWRDFFGGVTIKEIWAHLRRGDLVNAAKSLAALIWYVRGRVFIIPWRYRHRGMTAARRQLRKMGSSLSGVPNVAGTAPARSSRSSDPRV
jgi:glycosyltransferase involved in cell wall biosynthesis